MMARRLGKRMSNIAALVVCFQSAVVSTHEMWSSERKAGDWLQCHGQPRLTDTEGKQAGQCDLSQQIATIAQTAEKVYTDSDCCQINL